MGLPKVWVRTISDGLIRADHIIAVSAHPTPALPGKAPHWLLDATLAVPVGSGSSDGWDVSALHRTLVQTRAEPVGAPEAFAQLLAALHDVDTAGIISPVPGASDGRVHFSFAPFPDTPLPATVITTSDADTVL
ncbi:hypothetical protein ORV05_06710 [Amycolatopsis cynarae]|uniref:Uncharacterized protein n=1 Tax=Amycolatopsis cynarae TaxID=2995223 RepID=A0ABY7B679_9PSEU|nr:hypothetical protein [Amycolatopsis sp. HUAS 11-8]WAL67467.1 hypothetical protein ORV05_06710 [Amycolatopsis sp. HUAS 11-8]